MAGLGIDPAVDRRLASCGGEGESIALFFSDQIDAIARAKAICAGCSQVEPCLRGAIERREPCGVWGGQLFADGVILAHKRRRGRPRKDECLPATASVAAQDEVAGVRSA